MLPSTTTNSQVKRVPPELIRKILLLTANSDVEDINLSLHNYGDKPHGELPDPSQGRKLKPPARHPSLVCTAWRRIITATSQCWVTTISIRILRGPQSFETANVLTDFEDGELSRCKDLLKNSLGGDIDIFLRVGAQIYLVSKIEQLLADAISPYSNQIRQLVITGHGCYHSEPTLFRHLILSNQLNGLMILKLHTSQRYSVEWPKETIFLPRLTAVNIGPSAFNFIKGASWEAPNLQSMHMSVSNGEWNGLSALFASKLQLRTLLLRDGNTHGEPQIIPWRDTPPEAAIRLPFLTSLDLRETSSVEAGMGIVMLGNLIYLQELFLNNFLLGALCDLGAGERVQFPQVQLLTVEFMLHVPSLPEYTLPNNGVVIFPNLHTLQLHNLSVALLAPITSFVNRSQLKHLTVVIYERFNTPCNDRDESIVELSSLESVRLEGVSSNSFPAISSLLLCPIIKRLSILGPVSTDESILNSTWKKPAGRQWQNLEHFSITFDHGVRTPSLSYLSFLSQLTSLEVVLLHKDDPSMTSMDPRRLLQDWKTAKVVKSMRNLRSLRLVVNGTTCMAFLESFLSFVRGLKTELQRLEIRSPRRPNLKGFDTWFQSIQEFSFDSVEVDKFPNTATTRRKR